MPQGLLKSNTMVTNTTSEFLQVLGKMNFFAKGKMTGLDDAETDYTHMVCSRLMLSSDQHLDEIKSRGTGLAV